MKNTEDYNDYYFDAYYEFLSSDENCYDPWKTRRLTGSSGKISLRDDKSNLLAPDDNFGINQTVRYCLQQPWLIEPEEDCNFIYLKIRGGERKDSRLCPNKNRILIYPAGRSEDLRVICPGQSNDDEYVELFSEGWSRFNYKTLQNR